jgi:F420-non-reducing hydrogenase iron-sulfur subunit
MTAKRVVFLQKLMSFVGLEGRLHLAWISSAEAQKFVRVVTEFTEKVRDMGPSPIKDFRTPKIPLAFHQLGQGEFPCDGTDEAKVTHHG